MVHLVALHVYYMTRIVSSTMQHGLSPLYVASQFGHAEAVEILLKSGANPNLAGRVWEVVYSFYPLHVYCVLVHCSSEVHD